MTVEVIGPKGSLDLSCRLKRASTDLIANKSTQFLSSPRFMDHVIDAYTVYLRYIVRKQQRSKSEKSLVLSIVQLTLGTGNGERRPIARKCCSNQLQYLVLGEVPEISTESLVQALLDFPCYH